MRLEDLQKQIINKLKDEKDLKLVSVKEFSGELDLINLNNSALLQKKSKSMPSLYVQVDEVNSTEIVEDISTEHVKLSIYIATKESWQMHPIRRRLKTLLHNNDIHGELLTPLKSTKTELVGINEKISIYGMQFQCDIVG